MAKTTTTKTDQEIVDEAKEQLLQETLEKAQASTQALQIIENAPASQIGDIQDTDTAVTLYTDHSIILAEGIVMSVDSPDDEIDRMMEMVQSYVGVKPEKVGDVLGEWMTCIGCALVPFEREKKRIGVEVDEQSGEEYEREYTTILRWKTPLFKMAEKNKHGQNRIISGGGGAAVDFVRRYAQLGRAGDWKTPKSIMFTSEERVIENDKGVKAPGRMYRIDVRTLES